MIECPKCGSVNPSGSAFCDQCKSNLAFELIDHPLCPLCLTQYERGDFFCEKDGNRLIDKSELSFRCTKCGKSYEQDVKYCPEDGGIVASYAGNDLANVRVLQENVLNTSAPLGKRFVASLLDGLIGTGFMLPSIFCMITGTQAIHRRAYDQGLVLWCFAAALYLLPILYFLLKDGMGQGQSWGKKAMDLQVIQEESNKVCSYKKSFGRNGVMLLLNFVPLVGSFIEPIVLLASSDGKRLGDKAAKTIVVEIN